MAMDAEPVDTGPAYTTFRVLARQGRVLEG